LFGALFLALCATCLPARAASHATYVFYEKFPASNPDKWHVQSLSDGSMTYLQHGTYQIVRARPGTMRGWPVNVKVPSGFQFNVQLQLLGGSDPYEGVTFWDDLRNNFVLFALTPDGKAGLFRHTNSGYTELVPWRSVGFIHQGLHAVNSIAVNLDAVSAASGRTFLINGKPLGKPCQDIWRPALGAAPASNAGLFVGVLAGGYAPQSAKTKFVATHLVVLHASMYDGTRLGPAPKCPVR
ncbi:MAG TPA: hypothetical protein VHB98_17875, partial [Chloroflexota bacterium]|nr:hypothetical protein [Chloroflexota bacterium]